MVVMGGCGRQVLVTSERWPIGGLIGVVRSSFVVAFDQDVDKPYHKIVPENGWNQCRLFFTDLVAVIASCHNGVCVWRLRCPDTLSHVRARAGHVD